MRRWLGVSIGAIGVVVAGVWLALGIPSQRPAPARPSTQTAAGSIQDLLMDLELMPMDGQAPKPFALQSLDGRRVALADLAGRPALLYFWATW
jgi:cytochrome oxidase Cu insertion factor (SCO1/SenC/PrrC family)